MIELIQEAMESPAFWLLGGGAIVATVLGWTMSKNFGASLPVWQLVVIVLVELVAAAFFALKD